MSEARNRLEATLTRARKRLPLNAKEHPKSSDGQVCLGSIRQFEEFLYHSEYELAIDELIPLGRMNEMGEAFWQDLLAASQEIRLGDRVEICRQELARLRV